MGPCHVGGGRCRGPALLGGNDGVVEGDAHGAFPPPDSGIPKGSGDARPNFEARPNPEASENDGGAGSGGPLPNARSAPRKTAGAWEALRQHGVMRGSSARLGRSGAHREFPHAAGSGLEANTCRKQAGGPSPAAPPFLAFPAPGRHPRLTFRPPFPSKVRFTTPSHRVRCSPGVETRLKGAA